jgi:hypothetical protein
MDERAARVFADVMNRADVGVIQCRSGLGFAAEAFEGMRMLRNSVRQKFEGDEAVETRVLGFVDDAHPGGAEALKNPIVRNCLAEQA